MRWLKRMILVYTCVYSTHTYFARRPSMSELLQKGYDYKHETFPFSPGGHQKLKPLQATCMGWKRRMNAQRWWKKWLVLYWYMICILTLMWDNKSTSSNVEEFKFVYVGWSFQSRSLTNLPMSRSTENDWGSNPDPKTLFFGLYFGIIPVMNSGFTMPYLEDLKARCIGSKSTSNIFKWCKTISACARRLQATKNSRRWYGVFFQNWTFEPKLIER